MLEYNKDIKKDTLANKWLQAVVVDNNDPDQLQRVKIRIRELHREVVDAALPWALPVLAGSNTSTLGTLKVPIIGSKVWIQFLDESNYYPIYTGTLTTADLKNTELTATDYPNVYGFIDRSGNKFVVNTEQDTVEFTHITGTQLKISTDGTVTFTNASDTIIYSNGNTSIYTDGITNVESIGALNIKSNVSINLDAPTINLDANNLNLNTQTTNLKASTLLNLEAATLIAKGTNLTIEGTTLALTGSTLTLGGATSLAIDTNAALAFSGASAIFNLTGAYAINAASVSPVPLHGWAPGTPVPGAPTGVVVPVITPPSNPTVDVATAATSVIARSRPVDTPFTDQINY